MIIWGLLSVATVPDEPVELAERIGPLLLRAAVITPPINNDLNGNEKGVRGRQARQTPKIRSLIEYGSRVK